MENEYLGSKFKHDFTCKDDQLYQMIEEGYDGVLGICGIPPEECYDFCISQYARFNIPINTDIKEAIFEGINASLHVFDYLDPYLLFTGISDVCMTDDWSNYAYEVMDNGKFYEVSPENVETFAYSPGTSEEIFHYILSNPGLEALPNRLGRVIRDMLDGEYHGDETCISAVSPACRGALEDLCRLPDGVPNYTAVRAYFDLASWAATAWIIGPPGRDFLMTHHDIFHVVLEHREAILVDGAVIAPTHYRKLSRPPQSCYKCGIAAWCVEITMEAGGSRFICEHCLSYGMLHMGMATCGSKHCLLAQCPHHPYHYMGAEGIGRTRREYGQLGAVARGEAVTRIGGDKPLLFG